jgi:hypothetical protein
MESQAIEFESQTVGWKVRKMFLKVRQLGWERWISVVIVKKLRVSVGKSDS